MSGASFSRSGGGVERPPLGEGLQPLGLGPQRQLADPTFAQAGGEAGRVHPQHELPGLDDLTFAHQDFFHHATVHALDDLQLAGGHHLGFAPRDLVHLGQ
jgi:hypothetical protein